MKSETHVEHDKNPKAAMAVNLFLSTGGKGAMIPIEYAVVSSISSHASQMFAHFWQREADRKSVV